MKVNKINKTEAARGYKKSSLLEDNTNGDNEIISAVDDPKTAPIADLAELVKDQVEEGSGGTATVSDEEAIETAKEIQEIAREVRVDEAAGVASKNRLSDALDACLHAALRRERRGDEFSANLLVTGLPGSGKTAIIKDWGKTRLVDGIPVNVVYIDAKNDEIKMSVSGAPVYVKQDGESIGAIEAVMSRALDELKQPNSVLFLDEFNRQLDPGLRGSLLSLINERAVGNSKLKGGYYYFKNLLFSVIAINPSVPSDPGAAKLIQAELSRAPRTVTFNSEAAATLSYIDTYFPKKIDALAGKVKSRYFLMDLEDYLTYWDLLVHLVTGVGFNYDTEADLQTLEDEEGIIFNQRVLTDLISSLSVEDGDIVEQFRDWIDSYPLLKRNKDTLKKILDSYRTRTLPDLLNKYKTKISDEVYKAAMDLLKKVTVATAEQPQDAKNSNDDDIDALLAGLEDSGEDADLWNTTGKAGSGKAAMSAAGVREVIRNLKYGW